MKFEHYWIVLRNVWVYCAKYCERYQCIAKRMSVYINVRKSLNNTLSLALIYTLILFTIRTYAFHNRLILFAITSLGYATGNNYRFRKELFQTDEQCSVREINGGCPPPSEHCSNCFIFMVTYMLTCIRMRKPIYTPGIEPMTFDLLDWRSTNWANGPPDCNSYDNITSTASTPTKNFTKKIKRCVVL